MRAKPYQSVIKLIKQHLPNVRYGAEIGVYEANTSCAIMRVFPECHMTLIDLWQEHPPGSVYYDAHKVMGRLTQLEWDQIFNKAQANLLAVSDNWTVVMENSVRAANSPHIPDGSLDFVYLDANHMYAEVLADIRAWTPKIRTGGLIMGHDYGGKLDRRGIWGISKAVHEVFDQSKVIVSPGTVWAVIKEAT